jgi:hypothetical protein
MCGGASIRLNTFHTAKYSEKRKLYQAGLWLGADNQTMKRASKNNSKNFHVEFNEPRKYVVLYL